MALWRGRDIQVLITSSSTVTAASDFSAATDYAGFFKSVEFTEPEREVGETKLLGATSGAANSEIYEQDPTKSELTGELILSPKSGDTVDVSELFYTYTGSTDKIFNYASDPANPSLFIRFGDATNYVGFIMSGVKLKTLGGVKLEADGDASAEVNVNSAANTTYKVKGGTYAA